MSIELKLGRPCIAWNFAEDDSQHGIYVYETDSGQHGIYLPGNNLIKHFDNAKPDPDGEPMNGDEVEVSTDGSDWHTVRVYIGQKASGDHICENKDGAISRWGYVRHPKPEPTKRERVKEAVMRRKAYSQDVVFDDEFVDEILKICEVEE